MTKITKQPARDLYAEITERIISRMEQGVAPWQKPWSHYGKAKNYATGHVYTGVNFILMNSAPYEIPYYLSFKRAQELGGKVKKGAKAEFVVYFNVYFKDGEKTITQAEAQGREGIEVRKFLKHYCVFNISDIEGIDFKLPDLVLRDNDRFDHCDAIIRNYPHSPEPLVPVIVATETSPGEFLIDDNQIHLGVQFWPKSLAFAPTNRPMANDDGSFAWGVMPLR